MSILPITHVQFGTLTEAEWRAFAIEITTPSNRGSQETEGTPYDLRLGALANGSVCETCGENNKTCPGHWGFISLAAPCYNPEFQDVVCGIMKCICIKCFAPRISENVAGLILSQKKSSRFKAYRKKAEALKQCALCKEPLPYFFVDRFSIKMYYDDKASAFPISAQEAHALLMQISSKTMHLLGFNDDLSSSKSLFDEELILPQDKVHVHEVRPESFIFTVLPVPPTCVRPWVIRGSDRKDDDITDRINTICKLNIRLRADSSDSGPPGSKGRKRSGKLSELDRRKTVEDLHSNIWNLIDNSKEKNKNSRQHKGFRERLAGKDGHIQGNVAGKRCDFTARTVIVGGGSVLPLGWVGVPEHVAKTLSVPELVLEWNLDQYEKDLKEGKINSVVRQGSTIVVSQVTSNGTKPFLWKGEIGLQKYDVVNRQLRDGDWGVFNRQPTLRIESMQGVQIKIIPGYVFRLPLGMTRAFNADFDGDETNLHVPQSQGARVECSTIARTALHMVSAQNNAPIMGCVQNTLVLMYIMTETFLTPEATDLKPVPSISFPDGTPGFETMIDLSDFMDAVSAANISQDRFVDLLERAKKVYPQYATSKGFAKRVPGKIVASIVFPRFFRWSRKTDVNDKLPVVKIHDGIILPDSGPLCKKSIGGAANSAIHPLWKLSPDLAANVVSELQFITACLIGRLGFSMGISDCLPVSTKDVQAAVDEAMIKCEIINSSSKDFQDKEREINGALNEAMSVAPKLSKHGMNKQDRNALIIMKKSGAKGSDTNNGQIAGFVGQQNIDGKRMALMLSDGKRTLPHFQLGDNSPEARGFVSHSYLQGLKFWEVWFHAAGGRRGIVDTALKTADSGYAQKKIVKKIEDFTVHEDGTVRDSNKTIIQFMYGGDGFSAKELIFTDRLPAPFFCNPAMMAGMLCSKTESDRMRNPGALRPLSRVEMDLLVSFIESGCPGTQTEVTQRVTFNVKTCLRAAMAGVCIYEEDIPIFCRQIKDDFEASKAKKGYMAGLVAACSIGEPTTQLTLNGFHGAGIAAKDVTLGVPRLKEVLNATKNPSKPTCVAFLDDTRPVSDDSEASLKTVTQIAAPFVSLDVNYFLDDYELKYLPRSGMKKSDYAQSPIGILTYEEYEEPLWVTLSKDLGVTCPDIQPEAWVIVLKLNLSKMYAYNITPDQIAIRIEEEATGSKGRSLACVPSPLNIAQIEVYLDFSGIATWMQDKSIEIMKGDEPTRHLITPQTLEYFTAREVAMDLIRRTKVQGIPGITKTFVRKDGSAGASEWVIDTQGTNLLDLLCIPSTDPTRTVSDDIWEIYRVFGIEATRKTLIREITKILSFDGTYINSRHICLLIDAMCHKGIITSVNRDGISRDVGPLAKGMFEKAVDNFGEAAAFAEYDKMRGVSAAVMFGTLPGIGTGLVEIKDQEKMPARKRQPVEVPLKPKRTR